MSTQERHYERTIYVDGEELSEYDAETLADSPEGLTLTQCKDLRDHFEVAIAAIDAQLEAMNKTAQFQALAPDQTFDWVKRASFARSMKQRKLDRVEKRLGQLIGTRVGSKHGSTPLEQIVASSRESEAARTERTRLNIEAARIASQQRQQIAEHQARRERWFIKACEEAFTPERMQQLWARAAEMENGNAS